MGKVAVFDKITVRQVRRHLHRVVAAAAEDFGLAVNLKFGRVNPLNCIIHMELSIVDEEGVAQTKAACDFRERAGEYGLRPGDLGAELRWRGDNWHIVGLSVRSPKYPIILGRLGGGRRKKIRMAAGRVCLILGRDVPPGIFPVRSGKVRSKVGPEDPGTLQRRIKVMW
jgi:hypothetical protein